MVFDDTICASASAAGVGAVATVRVSGPDALRIAGSVVRLRKGNIPDAAGYSLHLAEVLTKDGSLLDQALVSVFRAPHSYTGEDSVEIGCHSSRYIVETLLSLLIDAGARLAGPGEFTRRAFLNGKMDLAQAEAVADVIAAESEAEHRVAFSQLKGGYSAELKALRDRLVELSALMELELDFSEEDVEFADRSKLSSLLELCIGKIGGLVDSFRDGNAIRNGVPVAIVGAPNSGKSTLLNALLGDDRAIVSDIPGTTRDTVEESLFLGGVKVRFIDTAGIRESVDPVERMGMERSLEAVRKARVVIVLMDPRNQEESLAVLRSVLAGVEDWQKVLAVHNKKDLWVCNDAGEGASGVGDAARSGSDGLDYAEGGCGQGQTADSGSGCGQGQTADSGSGCGQGRNCVEPERCEREIADAGALWISARTGEGLDKLKQSIADCCPESSDRTVVTNARHYQALRRALENLRAVRNGLGIESCPGKNGRLPDSGDEARGNKDFPASSGEDTGKTVRKPASHKTGNNCTCPVSTELLCEDLRAAIRELGSIFGEQIATDEVLGEIFGRFCIGK